MAGDLAIGEGLMKLKAIESETLQESVYNALVDAILSGRIAPGERITLEGIARQLNVSIMPVREAVRRLQARDFVSVEPNRRITVRGLSPESLREILEIRLLLESVAAERAAKSRTEEVLRQLEECARDFTEAPDEDSFLQANRRFHFALYQAAGMPDSAGVDQFPAGNRSAPIFTSCSGARWT